MSTGLRAIATGELALRLAAHRGGGDWTALAVATQTGSVVDDVAVELAEEITSLGDIEVTRVHASGDAATLAAKLAEAAGVALVTGVDTWSESEWQHIDELRSRLQRDERTVVVLSKQAFEKLVGYAPNLASWIASAWAYQPDSERITEDERQRRLAALREWSGLSDEEMLGRRQRGLLPGDPEYSLWLILLERGDLFGDTHD